MRVHAVFAVLIAGVALRAAPAGQGSAAPRFYDDDPLWAEADTQDASGVQPLEIDLAYDLIENLFLKPGDRMAGVKAMNVNTVDEVPDSNWYTNRLVLRELTVEQLARGPDTSSGPAPGRWRVIQAKSDGITPGFTIRDANEQLWFIKFDPPDFPAMATGAEVTVTKLMWALGYHVPENHIAHLRPENLDIDPEATVEPPGGRRRAMRVSDIAELLERASRGGDGGYRVLASRALAGRPIGRFRFYGTRPDDPNDVIPHEHRRELRGYGVFSAWLNHVDSKAINTLDTLIPDPSGRRVVRHNLLDFGSTLGSAAVEPRLAWEGEELLYEGHRQVGLAVLTLGWRIQPWRQRAFYEAPAVGRFPLDNTNWNPGSWQPRVPNPAFVRARADDRFWAARRVMALTDEMLAAVVRAGRFDDPDAEAFLLRALIERRDAIGRAYLTAVNPVVDPALSGDGALTFRNAAVDAGVASAPSGYATRWAVFDNRTNKAAEFGAARAEAPAVDAPPGLPPHEGAFVRVAIAAEGAPVTAWQEPMHVFFRRTGSAWKLVGLERQPE